MKSIDKDPKILFEDNHLLLLEKPAGTLSQPVEREEESAECWARKKIQSRYLASLFRLDRSVSGLLLFAKSSKAASRLASNRKNYFMRKSYLALVEGKLEEEGLFEDWMAHGDHRAIESGQDEGKHALLTYRVLDYEKGVSLVEIDLLTGRYHQIRFQFAKRSHPVVGDHKYGSKVNFLVGEIALHHYQLSLIHPVREELLLFSSEPQFLITY